MEALSKADRTLARWTWLRLQGHRCAVCGIGVAPKSSRGARWVLDYDRNHPRLQGTGQGPCPRDGECWDCVQGTTCRTCMLQLRHLRQYAGFVPRQAVNGVPPVEWTRRATAYMQADFRRVDGSDSRQAGG